METVRSSVVPPDFHRNTRLYIPRSTTAGTSSPITSARWISTFNTWTFLQTEQDSQLKHETSEQDVALSEPRSQRKLVVGELDMQYFALKASSTFILLSMHSTSILAFLLIFF
jgi:hypothetical protein